MRYVTLCLLLMLILVLPAAAQDGYPLPDDLQLITINNAKQIKHLVSIGGVLPERLSWSPDNKSLLAWTSEGIAIYDRGQLQKPPIRMDPSQQIHFDEAGHVVVGQSAEFDSISRWPVRSPSDNIQVKPNYQSDETLVELIHSNKVTTTLYLGSTATVDNVVFSPDEKFLVIASHFSMGDYSTWQLDLWDVASSKRIAFLLSSIDSLPQVAFRGNGKLLVIDYDVEPNNERTHVINILDGRTGENLRVDRDLTIPAYFSPDQRLITIFSKDQIEFWTDHLLGTVENQNYHSEQDGPPFAFSPDSLTFVKTDKLQIQLWDVPDDTVPGAPRSTITASDEIKRLYFSPDGSLLAAFEKQNKIEIWDAHSGTKLPLFTEAVSLSTAPVFSADSAFLYVYNAADTVKAWEIWDIKQSKQIASVPLPAVFSPDALWAAYWDGGHAQVLDFRHNQLTDLPVVDNDLGTVLDFNATNGLGFFAGQNFVVGYDLRTGREVLRKAKDEAFDALSFNADGSYFVTWTRSEKLRHTNFLPTTLWRTSDLQKPVSTFETSYGWQKPLLSFDGKALSILNGSCGDGGGGTYDLWNTTNGNNLSKDRYGYCGPYAHTFSPDGKWLVIGSVWQLEIVDIEKSLSESVDDQSYISSTRTGWISMEDVGEHHLVFSPDGTILAMAYDTLDDKDNFTNHAVSLYRFSDLLAQGDKRLDQAVLTIPDAQTTTFSPDGHWLLTDIGLWNLITGKQQATIASRIAAFTADSQLIATYDPSTGKLSLWGISTLSNGNNSPIISFDVQPKMKSIYEHQLAFSPDATLLYLKRTGDIQIWGVPKG